VVRLALRERIADTTSGFRAYGRAVMEVCRHDFPREKRKWKGRHIVW